MSSSCVTCGVAFEVSDEEKALHAKVNETFEVGSFPMRSDCLECNVRKKMIWRNERFLYHRKCDKSGKQILSVYPAGTPFPVYERSAWWGDDWDARDYGQDFDFSRPFFEQFGELLHKVPRQALNLQKSENCDYCNFAFESRNCYLCQCCYSSESLLNCYWILRCKDCLDCSYCLESERCFGCVDCNHAYTCAFCILSHNCRDSAFLFDCRGCSDCFGCVGLRHKSFCFFNEQLTEGDYKTRLQEFDWQNPMHCEKAKERLQALKLRHPHLASIQEKTENCTGDDVFESKDCLNCFQVYRSRDCINVQDAETNDALNCYHPGWSNFTYETYSAVSQRATAFSIQCWTGNDIFYSDNCQSCAHCFGCISLRHKEYCILNKQYTKEEYEAMLPRVRAHMERAGEWGRFFPVSLSPFGYNETTGQEYLPLTENEAKKRRFRWSPEVLRTTSKETIQWESVPKNIQEVDESFAKEILACEACGKNYKVAAQEVAFLKEGGYPIPHTCPECRHRERLSTRNPRKLWKRNCAKCKKAIETTFSPDRLAVRGSEEPSGSRGEIVYCEKCYLEAVY